MTLHPNLWYIQSTENLRASRTCFVQGIFSESLMDNYFYTEDLMRELIGKNGHFFKYKFNAFTKNFHNYLFFWVKCDNYIVHTEKYRTRDRRGPYEGG